uniref:Uncharacterized protein n=1 Tax=Setaria viridis TaxID=4556 RepID=A0A4U6VX81_SETVI|nr:hypothetical protein SEVIR_2G314550v2 [Setaria viridis]
MCARALLCPLALLGMTTYKPVKSCLYRPGGPALSVTGLCEKRVLTDL